MPQAIWEQLQIWLGLGQEIKVVGAVQMALRTAIIYMSSLGVIRLGSRRFPSEAVSVRCHRRDYARLGNEPRHKRLGAVVSDADRRLNAGRNALAFCANSVLQRSVRFAGQGKTDFC